MQPVPRARRPQWHLLVGPVGLALGVALGTWIAPWFWQQDEPETASGIVVQHTVPIVTQPLRVAPRTDDVDARTTGVAKSAKAHTAKAKPADKPSAKAKRPRGKKRPRNVARRSRRPGKRKGGRQRFAKR